MATPHNQANVGDIAKIVIMPGDPLRAEYIAKNYLTEVTCFNTVRNMFGYTGLFEGVRISIMGSGMGMPSMGIYSYELFHDYDVDYIMRIGSAGAFDDDVYLKDVIIAQGACTDSNYASQYCLNGTFAPIADYTMLSKAVEAAKELTIPVRVGNVLSSDIFYHDNPTFNDGWKKMHVLAVEMESAALYMNAARLGKHALCLLTVSDHLYRHESLTADERLIGFGDMMKVALNAAKKIVGEEQ